MFSIWDKQCGCYLHSGRNLKSINKCIQEGVDYLISDWSDDDEDDKKAIKEIKNMSFKEKEDFLKTFELEIEEHKEKIEDA
jgi:hypothetical protein